jgi:1,4-alpha-glucan branching enzyme
MTSDDRGSGPGDAPVADKDALQRAVEEKVAAADAAAGSEPVVNAAAPAKKTAKRAAAKKAPVAKKATAKKAPAKKAAAKKSG